RVRGRSAVSVDREAAAIPRRLEAPLVGRADELARLEREFRLAIEGGRLRFLTVVGPAGIGKSRLAKELETVMAGEARVVSGRCLSYGEGVTFRPLAEIVRSLVGETDDVEAALVTLVGEGPDERRAAQLVAAAVGASAPGAGVGAEETMWAVARLVELLAERRPLLVALDDL